MGQRVLGFAQLELPETDFGSAFDSQYVSSFDRVPTQGLTFLGLMALQDPPKESVPEAVRDWSDTTCHTHKQHSTHAGSGRGMSRLVSALVSC
jgi:magnesium-transporting ATPase (P-type)